MKLKVGDVVEFKKYEDIDYDERALLSEEDFPKSGKVKEICSGEGFFIEESPYWYKTGSVARVISDVDNYDLGVIREGDEVLVKATVNGIFVDKVRISSQIKKSDVVKILKRKAPERFIVQDDKYGMYIIGEDALAYDKSRAKIYNSRIEANDAAADMHLNTWEVLPYDD